MNPYSRGKNRKPRNGATTPDLVSNVTKVISILAAFYLGVRSGISSMSSSHCNDQLNTLNYNQTDLDIKVKERIEVAMIKNGIHTKKEFNKKPRFGRETSKFAVGLAKLNKKEFIQNYDYGFPENYDDRGGAEVILLYNGDSALPSNEEQRESVINDEGIGIPLLGVREATENCESMNVVVTQAKSQTKQCLAIAGNYESFHLQKWMRMGPKGIDSTLPLKHVGRGMENNGYDQFIPPTKKQIQKHWKSLQVYLDSLAETQAKLKPILSRIAIQNTVIVMVCNFGQSELLQNFVCSAKSKSFDISNVIVFVTDAETLKIAEGLGLAAFYDEKNFANLPKDEAGSYGDAKFAAMMYAKVVSVQVVNLLGYDLLFQDLDIVWYQNPLQLFQDKNRDLYDYDMLFQDDGARSVRYAPYCANSGFYFVRKNERTTYLLTSLLYSGDVIIKTGSHQQALNALIIEHTSLFGLKVKTLNGEDFPGGFHYHRRPELMHRIVENQSSPYIFHMSWTKNKDNKLLFFKQMGLWHVNEQCIGDQALAMLDRHKGESSAYLDSCCSSKPLISCHYKDKASVVPCNESPPIDKGKKSFWA